MVNTYAADAPSETPVHEHGRRRGARGATSASTAVARTAEAVAHDAVLMDAVPSAVDASRGEVSESCARRGLDPLNPPTIDPLPQD